MKATARCDNCGDEFANHHYVKDSISKYRCPHPHQETCYGFFHGGDPRNFHPGDGTLPEEIMNHDVACKLWNEAEARGEIPEPEKCPSGWVYVPDGNRVAHVLRSHYGIGVYVIETEQFFEEE